jgi:hypothetical protein
MSKKEDDKITIEVSREAVESFLRAGEDYRVDAACRTALAKHKVDERAERLGLPLKKIAINAVQDAGGKCISFGDMDYVCLDKAEAQRDLFLASPEMAEWIDCATEWIDALDAIGADEMADQGRAVLVKAGWIDE